MLDEDVNMNQHRLELIQEGLTHMNSGGSLTDFKDKLRTNGETNNTIIFVSERILDAEFQKSIGSGWADKISTGFFRAFFGVVALIGIAWAVYAWNHGYISIWSVAVTGVGIMGMIIK